MELGFAMANETPASSVADSSRTAPPPPPAPRPITELKDLDEASARHFVAAYLPSKAPLPRLAAFIGFGISFWSIFGMNVDSLPGYAMLSIGSVFLLGGVGTVMLHKIRGSRARQDALIAFPLSPYVDAVIRDLAAQQKAAQLDNVLAALMRRVRGQPDEPITHVAAKPKFVKTLMVWLVFVVIVVAIWAIFAPTPARDPDSSSAPVKAGEH
jgi:hypothetical protein